MSYLEQVKKEVEFVKHLYNRFNVPTDLTQSINLSKTPFTLHNVSLGCTLIDLKKELDPTLKISNDSLIFQEPPKPVKEPKYPVDLANHDAQCLVAACLHEPFPKLINHSIHHFIEIPTFISNTDIIHTDKVYESPFYFPIEADWKVWYTMEQTDFLDNLVAIYQMIGTLPQQFVPHIPPKYIYMYPKRLEHYDRKTYILKPPKSLFDDYSIFFKTNIQLDPKPEPKIIFDPLVESFISNGGLNIPMELEEEPIISLVEHKPKLSQFEVMVLGKYLPTKDITNIVKTNSEYKNTIGQFQYLPHDVDTLDELLQYDLNEIMKSPIIVHNDGYLHTLRRTDAWFMVRFLLYMDAVCEELGYPIYTHESPRDPNLWNLIIAFKEQSPSHLPPGIYAYYFPNPDSKFIGFAQSKTFAQLKEDSSKLIN